MKLDRSARSTHLRRPPLRSSLVALLAMAAMLVGLLAISSTHAAHETGGTAPKSASDQSHRADVGFAVTGIAAAGSAAAALSVAAHSGFGMLGCLDCVLDCALLAITCTIVIALTSLIILARSPSVYRRLLDAGGPVVRRLGGPTLDIYCPRLTILSISRI
ncbi:hypothetical protein [Cryobacterium sp. HLT2-28]|uniref:hypothetical protein n=1 Tax=Cryobacterium sp. HLT2-28 TaxID=1259146 RepID=UPI00106BA372|nr:hypothetical protein [Cryobacterium sp. HLT2-28]TFB92567.1 hypothetical protein E3O48_12305 [Cryobacterium sp. HLT2-28]